MSKRNFRVIKLNEKKLKIGNVSISYKASPGSAARKLLTSIAHYKGLMKNKKASMPKVKFCIQEYTQGSLKKIYGPYIGYYKKYTSNELKKAETANGKVKFTMKPIVKLIKKNKMKGGIFGFLSSPSCPKKESLDTIMKKYRIGTGTYSHTNKGVSNKKTFFNKIKMAEVNENSNNKKLGDYKFYKKRFGNTHTLYAIPNDSYDYKKYFSINCNKSMEKEGYTHITIQELKKIYKNNNKNYLNNSIWNKYLE